MHPAALRSSAAGSLPLRKSAVPRAGQLTSSVPAPRYGFAVVIPGRYSSRPCVIFALRAVLACVPHRCGPSSAKTPQSLPGVQDTAVPAVGADSVSHHGSVRQHTPPPRNRAASHRLRGFARINVVASCSYSKGSACSRSPLYPARPSVRRSLLWAVPAQVPEAVCPPHGSLSLSAVWSLRSPARGPAKASGHPTLPDRLRDQHSAALRVLGHLETQRLAPASRPATIPTTSPAPPPSL